MLISVVSCGTNIIEPSPNTDTYNESATNKQDTSKSTDTTESQKATENSTDGDNKNDTPDNEEKNELITFGGGKPCTIIYEDEYASLALTLIQDLRTLDKKASYTSVASTKSTDSDGSFEILLGLTDRALSTQAKNSLDTYLDFLILATSDKIAIYANTAERLNDAIEYFISVLTYTSDNMLCYPSSEPYLNAYSEYAYPNLSISGVSIKNFSIIIPKNATSKESIAANTLLNWIATNTGYSLTITSDDTSASTNEIIIGNVNRTECGDYGANIAETRIYSAITKNGKLLLYAGNEGNYASSIKAFTDNVTITNGAVNALSVIKNAENTTPPTPSTPTTPEKKKAIFIGNSFIYWGGCVTFITNDASNESLRAAGGDKGYFNEICKANGMNVDVYNYTYGGQNLEWIYENKLKNKGADFLDSFDYVFISEAGQNKSSFKSTVNKIANLFKNAEEKVYLAHEYTFSTNATHIINALDDLASNGFKIVAWGKLVNDVYNGKASVPNATLTYNKNTFIKNASSSEKMSENAAVISLSGYGDSFHPNPLSGYITAQMCFSVITGISAVGQRYDFCWDKTIAPQYDLQNFLAYQYGSGQTSNFIEVFNSPADMLGLQKLMNEYIEKYN